MNENVGKTKDAGYQFGLRKTFDIQPEHAWSFLFSGDGLKIWLGNLTRELQLKREFSTTEGITGFIRVLKLFSHVRLSWKKSGWPNESVLQIRVIPTGNRTTISFHQENLLDANQRKEVKEYWNKIMMELTQTIDELKT